MDIKMRIPEAAVSSLESMHRAFGDDLAVHIGAVKGTARLCLEFAVGVPGRAEMVTVAASYFAGPVASNRTQMYLVDKPADLLAWLKSDRSGDELSVGYSADAGGLVIGVLDGDTMLPGTVLEASPMTGYDWPVEFAYKDSQSGEHVVWFDGDRFAAFEMPQVRSSYLVADLEGCPLNRKLFAATLATLTDKNIGEGDRFVSADQPQKDTPKMAPIPPAPGFPTAPLELPELPLGPFGAEPSLEEPPAPESDAASEVVSPEDIAKPKSRRKKTEAPQEAPAAPVTAEASAEAASTAPEIAAEADEAGDTGPTETDSGASTDDADSEEVPASGGRSRRRTADLDREAETRLSGRQYAVMPPADAVFKDMALAAATDRYREITALLGAYGTALRDAYLDVVVKESDSSASVTALKDRLLAVLQGQ